MNNNYLKTNMKILNYPCSIYSNYKALKSYINKKYYNLLVGAKLHFSSFNAQYTENSKFILNEYRNIITSL